MHMQRKKEGADDMKNTVLITGGNSGIGLALAIRYLKDGNNVIICGRNEEKLKKTANEIPGLKTILADVSLEEDRNHLFETVKTACPDTNILINNAGIQQKIDVTAMDWQLWKNELNTNLEGPMHLCGLFAPFLAGKENAQIINVSSGLAFRPPVWAPVYGATKAGMHSFTFVLREQLREKGVAVKEIIPPAVGTNLGGGVSQGYGADLDEFADSVYKDLLSDKEEVGFGYTNSIADMTRRTLEQDALEVSKRFLNN